jgi:acyl carrier protein
MKGSIDQSFKNELKQLIHTECRLGSAIKLEDIPDTEVLFGPESSVGLDSIDALQISLALQKKYNITITDSKELRRVFVCINSLADHIKPE